MAKSDHHFESGRRERRRRRKAILITILEFILVIAASALTAFLFFSSVTVQENSMSPTLQAGERVFVRRAAYTVRGVKRGDLIAYRGGGGTDTSIHIKRVVALPGETIEIKDGLILIDGKTYIENREFPNITNPGIAANGIRLGGDEYFVLGDNRNNSEDSRFSDVGNIKKSQIYGKVWFRSQPFSRMGFVR
ncbi:MAG: signal peptidase I [Lachnospiraceae bacterium]|nr:signal peptidase I [Lachnospiraceae bacterium]